MENELNGKLPYSKTVTYLFALALFASALTVLVGAILLPIAAALLASLLLFEKRKAKPLSVSVAVAAIILDTVMAVMAGTYFPSLAPVTVISALILFFCYGKGLSKGEAAVYLTSALVILLGASLVLGIFSEIGEYSFEALSLYVEELSLTLRDEFVKSFSNFTITLSDGSVEQLISESDAIAIFDNALSVLLSFAVIVCFILAGLTLKLYRVLLIRLSNNDEKARSWRFSVTMPVVIFYVLLTFVSLFTELDGTLFSVTLYNLYYIFMAVHAYLGLRFLITLKAVRQRPIFILLLLSSVVLFSSTALTLLSAVGVVSVFLANREKAGK